MDTNGPQRDGMHEFNDSEPKSFTNDPRSDADFGVETSPHLGDPQIADPLQTIEVTKQMTANDAVAGEPVTQGVADDPPGPVSPIEGIPDDEENLESFEATDGELGPADGQEESRDDDRGLGASADQINIDPDFNPDVQDQ